MISNYWPAILFLKTISSVVVPPEMSDSSVAAVRHCPVVVFSWLQTWCGRDILFSFSFQIIFPESRTFLKLALEEVAIFSSEKVIIVRIFLSTWPLFPVKVSEKCFLFGVLLMLEVNSDSFRVLIGVSSVFGTLEFWVLLFGVSISLWCFGDGCCRCSTRWCAWPPVVLQVLPFLYSYQCPSLEGQAPKPLTNQQLAQFPWTRTLLGVISRCGRKSSGFWGQCWWRRLDPAVPLEVIAEQSNVGVTGVLLTR